MIPLPLMPLVRRMESAGHRGCFDRQCFYNLLFSAALRATLTPELTDPLFLTLY